MVGTRGGECAKRSAVPMQKRRPHRPTVPVEKRREIAHRLRCISEPVQDERSAGTRAKREGFRALENSCRACRRARRVLSGRPIHALAEPRRDGSGDRNQPAWQNEPQGCG